MLSDIRIKEAPAGTGAFREITQQNNRRGHYTRRLPPFGKQLASRLRQGNRAANCVWIACGTKAWDRAKSDLKRPDSAALCLPFGNNPTAYHWPVTGLSCVAVHTGGCDAATLKSLGTELIKAGAERAVILDVEGAFDSYAVYFKPTEYAA